MSDEKREKGPATSYSARLAPSDPRGEQERPVALLEENKASNLFAAGFSGFLAGFFIATALYFFTVRHGLVWDDLIYAEAVRAGATWLDAFGSAAALNPHEYFRPLALASLMTQLASGPVVAHATQIALFGLIAGSSGFLAAMLTEGKLSTRRVAGVATGVVVALHSAASEPTAWISGRFDLMATLFVLWAVMLAVPRVGEGHNPNVKILAGSAVLCSAASLSKDTAVLGLVFLALIYLFQRFGRPGMAFAGGLLGFGGALAWRDAALVPRQLGAEASDLVPLQSAGWEDKALVFFEGGADLWGTAVAPFIWASPYKTPIIDWSPTALSQTGFIWLTALAAVLLCALLAIGRAREGDGKGAALRLMTAVLPFYCLAHPGIYLATFASAENHVADRFLLLPMAVAIPACAAWLCEKLEGGLSTTRIAASGVLLLWATASGATSVALAGAWKDDATFWVRALNTAPETAGTPRASVAALLNSAGRYEEALEVCSAYVSKARERGLKKIDAAVFNNAANALFMMGRRTEAREMLEELAKEGLASPIAMANLSKFLLAEGKIEEAERAAMSALIETRRAAGTAQDAEAERKLLEALSMILWTKGREADAEMARASSVRDVSSEERAKSEAAWEVFKENPRVGLDDSKEQK